MKAEQISAGANHPRVGRLYGWSISGTSPVLNLRNGTVGGDILARIGPGTTIFPYSIDFSSGVYVELVSGTLDHGVLYSF